MDWRRFHVKLANVWPAMWQSPTPWLCRINTCLIINRWCHRWCQSEKAEMPVWILVEVAVLQYSSVLLGSFTRKTLRKRFLILAIGAKAYKFGWLLHSMVYRFADSTLFWDVCIKRGENEQLWGAMKRFRKYCERANSVEKHRGW